MKKEYFYKWLWVVAISALMITLLAACGGGAQQEAAPAEPAQEEAQEAAAEPAKEEAAEPAQEEAAAPAGDKPTIRLAENPWSGSQVNVAVAKILLEEQLD